MSVSKSSEAAILLTQLTFTGEGPDEQFEALDRSVEKIRPFVGFQVCSFFTFFAVSRSLILFAVLFG
jgi:hypothetical protein